MILRFRGRQLEMEFEGEWVVVANFGVVRWSDYRTTRRYMDLVEQVIEAIQCKQAVFALSPKD